MAGGAAGWCLHNGQERSAKVARHFHIEFKLEGGIHGLVVAACADDKVALPGQPPVPFEDSAVQFVFPVSGDQVPCPGMGGACPM